MTLEETIKAQIRASGPISIATYMGLCLTHPREGYYGEKQPLGTSGDFITAPEISQMFGELIGFFLVNLWQQMREPKSFTLLELGPGCGTLMADALRVAARAPGFLDALHLQLFEASPAMRREQEKLLGQYHPYWQDEIDAVGDDPLLVVANEFFDALPIRQFVRGEKRWHERLVGLADDRLAFGLSPTPLPDSAFPETLREAEPGAVYEVSLAARDTMNRLATIVARQGGAILAIDYGHQKSGLGDTLQAVRAHAFADPLERPGETDLSAHVDFELLGESAEKAGLLVHPVTTQRDFLRSLGIEARAAALTQSNPGEAENIAAALHRLVSAAAMGHLFKVLCVASPGLKPIGVSP